jgi:hypothetical protein
MMHAWTGRFILTMTAQASEKSAGLDLSAEIMEMVALCEGKRWETDDSLGVGELLCAA